MKREKGSRRDGSIHSPKEGRTGLTQNEVAQTVNERSSDVQPRQVGDEQHTTIPP